MSHLALVPGMLDAELAYRRERLSSELGGARRTLAWVSRLRRRPAAPEELTLAA